MKILYAFLCRFENEYVNSSRSLTSVCKIYIWHLKFKDKYGRADILIIYDKEITIFY